jgi:NAD(P)-dependent dehydrogenase (short-subunit alcohol dehydrogenase family)
MNSRSDFQGKVVFVTGAANGIGRATAVAFAKAGASVALADIDVAESEVTAGLIRNAGGKALIANCNVTIETDVTAALEQTISTFGGLDIAFNNAGEYPRRASAAEITEEEWRHVFDVNVLGIHLCMRNEIPIMLARAGGIIVNTSSGAGIVGIRSAAAYAATKHAVIGLTRSAALDYATRGIRINAVCPGITDTRMVNGITGGTAEGRVALVEREPIGRLGLPEEIASAVLWLSSDDAGFMIGSALAIDGGYTCI